MTPQITVEIMRWLDDVEDSAPGQVALLAAPVLEDEGYTPDEVKAIIRYWNEQP